MYKRLYFIATLVVCSFSFVNAQQYGNLTVFSEDGDKFFLVLNGEKQNDEAQTNIRVEELNQPYYSARVMFEDKTLATITKNNLMIVDADGKFMDVTYKIKKDKNKKVKMSYYSMIPVQPDFVPPSGMYVRQFGQPVQQPVQQVQGGIRQTTTTTTTTTNNNTIGASVNVPGMNMNITISDPDMDVRSSSTTTHHTTTTHSGGHHQQQQQQPQYTGNCKGWPMSAADFNAAKSTINESSFDDTKLSTAKSIASSNCLTSDQIVQICKLFSFEDNKLAFAKYAYQFTTDPKNYFKVNNVFSFSSSKEELNDFIQGQ